MFSCALFACAMALFQSGRDQADVMEQLRPHAGSDDISWVRASEKQAPQQIRGPVWTSGLALHQTKARSVWMTPGPSARGTSFGLGVSVDF